MNAFSPTSLDRLSTCHPDLQRLFNAVVQTSDCTILVGFRDEADQDIACHDGKSCAPWPTSPHNKTPSEGVDVAPYPIDWRDIERFKAFAVVVKSTAQTLGIGIKWGGDFLHLHDYDHWELAWATNQ